MQSVIGENIERVINGSYTAADFWNVSERPIREYGDTLNTDHWRDRVNVELKIQTNIRRKNAQINWK